jgi:poly-beta-hydroxyalkanoate depolymerase
MAIEVLLGWFGRKVENDRIGQGRPVFDGTCQVMGFYWLGIGQHIRNFKQLIADGEGGNESAAKRQLAFYRWYNMVHHHPEGFIRDTFIQIFARNALMRGTLRIGDKAVGVKDFPAALPVWALAGRRDDIAPAAQALGHMDLLPAAPGNDRLSLLCDAGHMGLFRSGRILEEYYSRIAAFLLARSDPTPLDKPGGTFAGKGKGAMKKGLRGQTA